MTPNAGDGRSGRLGIDSSVSCRQATTHLRFERSCHFMAPMRLAVLLDAIAFGQHSPCVQSRQHRTDRYVLAPARPQSTHKRLGGILSSRRLVKKQQGHSTLRICMYVLVAGAKLVTRV